MFTKDAMTKLAIDAYEAGTTGGDHCGGGWVKQQLPKLVKEALGQITPAARAAEAFMRGYGRWSSLSISEVMGILLGAGMIGNNQRIRRIADAVMDQHNRDCYSGDREFYAAITEIAPEDKLTQQQAPCPACGSDNWCHDNCSEPRS